jgi:hypothetical protein
MANKKFASKWRWFRISLSKQADAPECCFSGFQILLVGLTQRWCHLDCMGCILSEDRAKARNPLILGSAGIACAT